MQTQAYAISQSLTDILAKAIPILALISEKESSSPLAPGKWSRKEILGHLCDSAFNNHRRIVQCLLTGDIVTSGYQQDEWVNIQNYSSMAWAMITDLWTSNNRHIAHITASADPSAMTKPVHHSNWHLFGYAKMEPGDTVRLYDLLWDYLYHLEHHLYQISPTYIRTIEKPMHQR